MIQNYFIIFIFLVSPLCGNQKECRQLHHNAESAMQKSQWHEAIGYYHELIEKIACSTTPRPDWQTFVDTYLRLSEAYLNTNQLKEANETLEKLLQKKPPPQFVNTIQLHQARCLHGELAIERAYLQMRQVQSQVPIVHWNPADRCFLHTLEVSLNQNYDELLKKAERMHITKQYAEAKQIYQKVLKAIESGHYPKVAYTDSLLAKKIALQLADVHYVQAQSEGSLQSHILYLAALYHSKKSAFDKTLQEFSTGEQSDTDVQGYLQASFECGALYFHNKQDALARTYFEKVCRCKQTPLRLFAKSASFLAEIYLRQGHYEYVGRLCQRAKKGLQKRDALQEKFFFLQAQASYQLGKYPHAATLFKSALKVNRRNKEKIYLSLARCLIKMGPSHYPRAQKYLSVLDGAQATLLQAKLYLLQGQNLLAQEALLPHLEQFQDEEKLSAYHLLALCTKDEKIWIDRATKSQWISCPNYSDSWFLKGKSALEQNQDKEAQFAFENCLDFQQKGACDHESLLEKQLEPLLEQTTCNYLKGLLYALFSQRQDAMNALTSTTEPRAHFLLAKLYFEMGKSKEAHDYFLQIITEHPDCSLASQCLLWLAECQEKIEPNTQQVALYRARLFNENQEAAFAPEAYFKYYSLCDYFEGKSEALVHLKEFPLLFPQSSLNVAAHFLLGMHADTLEQAKKELKQAVFTYDSLPKHAQQVGTTYFRYLAMLKLGHRLYQEGLPEAVVVFDTINQDFNSHSPAKQLQEENQYHPILQESQYFLAKMHLKLGNLAHAEKIFLEMMHHYQERKITQGLFVALVFKEQARCALCKKQKELALKLLDCASAAGELFLTAEEKKTIAMLQKKCHEESLHTESLCLPPKKSSAKKD